MRAITWVCILFLFKSQAQNASDSITMLNEVVVFGLSLDEYAAGTSIQSIELGESGSLQDLGNNSALFFKNYGNGGLSTISLRGTSASHTNVLWNGIPVNSPTLGQSDYSVFPSFLMDKVSIIKGSTSSLFGSGSIGGTVVLDNSVVHKDSLLTLYSSIGSFGQINGGIKLHLSLNQNFLTETRLFYGRIANDFRYRLRGEEIKQPNAAISRLGVSQKLNYQFRNHSLFAELAYAENDREVQPTKTSASRDQLFTKNLRGVVSHEQNLNKVTLFASVGYAGETTIYNVTSETVAHTFSGQYSIDFPIMRRLSSRVGVNTFRSLAKSENYSKTQHQDQIHIYSSFSSIPIDGLRLSLNLRESFHDSEAVFTPSFGAESTLGPITFRGQLSKGYRIPTLNDMFWTPGGNPNLKPERSKNAEVGLDYNISKHSLSITGFTSNVNDWIQWTPNEGVWSPKNLREVVTKGIEAKSSLTFLISEFEVNWNLDYEYTLSRDQSIVEKNQLPYVPKHSGFSSLEFSRNEMLLNLRMNYTGLRFTTLTNSRQSELDEFMLFDIVFEHSKILENPRIKWRIAVNNVFNKEYENVSNTAMPGRNFLTELIIKL